MIESNGDSPGKPFTVLDLDAAEASHVNLHNLHAQVLGHWGRVELVRRGGACVLISKDELDGLEKALEILSSTDTARLMRQQVALVARVATPRAQAPSPAQPVPPVLFARARSFDIP